MGYLSKREIVRKNIPCNKVVILKRKLTTNRGSFEAGTKVYIQQNNGSVGQFVDVCSSEASDWFNLSDYINCMPNELYEHQEEIRRFSEDYFKESCNKETRLLNQKISNKLNAITAMFLFMGLVPIVGTSIGLGLLINEFLPIFPFILPLALPTLGATAFFFLLRNKIKEFNREQNLEYNTQKIMREVMKVIA